ncbi:hypothetical protein MFLAVUS_001936 [Mucor flavus]|uniref:Uncharacterized protein n=1 Tax=Mucor flavus TaxID=439312 RepID=A0ABP9YNV1_9FUNG
MRTTKLKKANLADLMNKDINNDAYQTTITEELKCIARSITVQIETKEYAPNSEKNELDPNDFQLSHINKTQFTIHLIPLPLTHALPCFKQVAQLVT